MEERWTCMVCEKLGGQGIHVLSRFICSDCEWDMVHADTGDELYGYFVERLRPLWEDILTGDSLSDPGEVGPGSEIH